MDLEKLKVDIKPLIEKCNRYIEQNEKLSEDDIKTKLIEPLFILLGWDVTDKSGGDNQVREQKNQPSGKPDYIFYIEDRIAFFLEAKKLQEIDDKDIKQAYNYAFRKSKRWAVLSNFKETLILICDKKEKHITKHIYKRLSYEDYLENITDLLLLTPESFKNELIDKKAIKDGQLKKVIKIDDELLEDITLWRKRLLQSVKNNNSKKYDKDSLADIVQTIIDRIIFIRTVEDRKKEAVKDETIKSLLNEYEINQNLNLKNKLDIMFRNYDKIYNSKLFTFDEKDINIRHECENVKIDNKTLFYILKGTYEKGETIEYKFDEIDADILGAVYENYLGYIQERRNEMGIFYTPIPIVEYVIKHTIEQITKGKKPKQVDKIKIVDPACGSGSFLIKAVDYLNGYYKKNDKVRYNQKFFGNGSKLIKGKEDLILENNIYGVDLDTKACEITKLNLLLKAMESPTTPPHRLPNLRNIKMGNSLISDKSVTNSAFDWNQKNFDCVIGNPPWGAILTKNEKDYFNKYYHVSLKNLNTFDLFVRRATSIVKKHGLIGFLIPKNSTKSMDYRELRYYLLKNFEIVNLKFFGKFPNVTQEFVTIIIKNTKPKPEHDITVNDNIHIRQNLWLQDPNYIFNPYAEEFNSIFKKIENKKFKTFEELGFFIRRGEEISKKGEIFLCGKCKKWFTASKTKIVVCKHCGHKQKNDDVKRYNIVSKSKTESHRKKIIDGHSIDLYQIDNVNYYDDSKRGIDTKSPEMYEGLKIVLKKISGMFRASINYDDLTTQNVYCIKNDNKEKLWFLLGLLNSSLFRFYYQKRINLDAEFTTAISIEFIKQLRIPENNKDVIEMAKNLSDMGQKLVNTPNIMEKQTLKENFEKLRMEIDNAIYKLYDLTPNEIKIINDYFSQ